MSKLHLVLQQCRKSRFQAFYVATIIEALLSTTTSKTAPRKLFGTLPTGTRELSKHKPTNPLGGASFSKSTLTSKSYSATRLPRRPYLSRIFADPTTIGAVTLPRS